MSGITSVRGLAVRMCAGLIAVLVVAGAAGAQEIRIMKATFYDQRLDGPVVGGKSTYNFGNYRSGDCGADNTDQYTYNMVTRTLAVDTLTGGTFWKRPRRNVDLVQNCNSSHLDYWFDSKIATSTTCRQLYFQRSGTTTSGSPIWRFEDPHFFPIDDAPGAQLHGNTWLHNTYGKRPDGNWAQSSPDGKDHNYNWTMVINASFTYRGGEKFFFKGDDDLWVFINNKLALDLGGIHSPRLQGEVRVDEVATQLMLEKGKTYDVDIFFAERKGAGSWVLIETTMDLYPINLSGIDVVDKAGAVVTQTVTVEGQTQFCARPNWSIPSEGGSCRNYEAPPIGGGSVDVTWMIDNQPVGAKSACITIDPTNPVFAAGKEVVLKAQHDDGFTKLVTLVPKLNIVPDSVFLVGNGRMEEVWIRFNGPLSSLAPVWKVTLSTDGITATIDQSTVRTRTDGTVVVYVLPAASRGPAGASSITTDAKATFTKTETGKPEETTTAPLVDRMSPVIGSAVLEGSATSTTLRIAVSEELQNVTDLLESHLTFKAKSGAAYSLNPGTWKSTKESKTVYVLTIPPLASPMPQIGDSVSLVNGNQFTRDLAGNTPKAFHVQITGELTITPLLMHLRGRGRLDTVVVDFGLNADLLPQGWQVKFPFGGTERIISAQNSPVIAGKTMTVIYRTGVMPLFNTYSPAGAQATLHHPMGSKPAQELTFRMQDEIGPVIDGTVAPNFIPVKTGANAHTLTFQTSEQLAGTGVLTAADLLFKRGDSTYTLKPAEVVVVKSGTRDYTATFDLNATVLPQPGDSVSLAPSVRDMAGTAAPGYFVAITGSAIAPNYVASAAYFDRNADGQIDEVHLRFKEDLVYLPRGIVLKNEGSHSVDTASDTVDFPEASNLRLVRVRLGPNNSLSTNVTYVVNGGVKLGSIAQQSFQGITSALTFDIHDSVPPVVTGALYRPGSGQGDSRIDTLEVTFSEPVTIAGSPAVSCTPFELLRTSDGLEYSFELRQVAGAGSSRAVFAVLSRSNGVSYPSDGDSLWIAVPDRVADTVAGGNAQNDPANRRVAMTVIFPPVKYILANAPNPFVPGQTAIPAQIAAVLPPSQPRRGTVVQVKPTTVLREKSFTAKATATIYDALGNIVASEIALERGTDDNLYMVWNGHNRSGRKVGAGTYTARITITDSVNGRQLHQAKIGVKR